MTPPLRLVFWETTKACNLTCRHRLAAASIRAFFFPGAGRRVETIDLADTMRS